MNIIKSLVTIGFVVFMLSACSGGSASKISEWEVPDSEFPLSEAGPYYFGRREMTIVDESRDGREIELVIWYPAAEETDALSMKDAPANKDEAPYPLILAGDGLFDEHLATHGFVMVEVRYPDAYANWDRWLIDHPRDILFALDQLADSPPDGLEGLIDTDHAGFAGISSEGYDALAISGARIDPESYLARCASAEPGDPAPEAWWIDYICNISEEWDDLTNLAGPSLTSSADGLWQPLTDPRIQAVMPIVPEGAWLFGESGLAAADRPTMILAGTEDEANYYDLEAAYIFEHLGTADKYMISFVDQTHFLGHKPEQELRMRHFVTAFFGYYLHGREDFDEFFSEDFVEQYNDLAWGIYNK